LLCSSRLTGILVALLGTLSPVAIAQQASISLHNADYHMLQDSARKVYTTSAFAHGHRHGYEEGFHAGDEDYHLRHVPNPTGKATKQNGYKREFGDKQTYMRGFTNGFRAGYADSYAGQPFRSNQEIAELEIEYPPSQPIVERAAKVISNYLPPADSKTFDQGAEEGYKHGFSSTDATSFAPGLGEQALVRCQSEHQYQPTFCGGYAIGFLLGKDDLRSLRALEVMDSDKIPPKR
jgi:hypothetical protein